jgi:hypothetical protein
MKKNFFNYGQKGKIGSLNGTTMNILIALRGNMEIGDQAFLLGSSPQKLKPSFDK